MANAWSKSVDDAGSSVTKATSVRSTWSSGRRCAAAVASASTSAGKLAGTWNWVRIAASPAASAPAGSLIACTGRRSACRSAPGQVGGELRGGRMRIDRRRRGGRRRFVRDLAAGAPVHEAVATVGPIHAHRVAAPIAALTVAAVDEQRLAGVDGGRAARCLDAVADHGCGPADHPLALLVGQ